MRGCYFLILGIFKEKNYVTVFHITSHLFHKECHLDLHSSCLSGCYFILIFCFFRGFLHFLSTKILFAIKLKEANNLLVFYHIIFFTSHFCQITSRRLLSPVHKNQFKYHACTSMTGYTVRCPT